MCYYQIERKIEVKEQDMDINLFMRCVGYFIVVAMIVMIIYGIIRSIFQKKIFDVIQCFCMLVFMAFMTSTIIFGGSAFLGNAPAEYELYEAGSYYLCDRGNYTKVSYEIYTYMQVIEIVGIIFFAIGFVMGMVKNKKETGSFFGQPKREKQLLSDEGETPFTRG